VRPPQFEWDPKKARSNEAKHAVSFEEAITVFADPLARIFEDPTHSEGERREIIIGHSNERRLILVSFTGTENNIRLLSARKATQMERKDYEENVKS
jgi:uncharacterized DUF497 family protein